MLTMKSILTTKLFRSPNDADKKEKEPVSGFVPNALIGVKDYGKETLRTVFGANFVDTVEFSITKIVSKEKNVDGGKNTRKSKDGISTEARI